MILQPGGGPIDGAHYLPSSPDTIAWGWLPGRDYEPVLRVASGDVVTIDTVSHEGMLEEFEHDPVGWFGGHGVPRADVLDDAVTIAGEVRRDDESGPHVVTGPIAVMAPPPVRCSGSTCSMPAYGSPMA